MKRSKRVTISLSPSEDVVLEALLHSFTRAGLTVSKSFLFRYAIKRLSASTHPI